VVDILEIFSIIQPKIWAVIRAKFKNSLFNYSDWVITPKESMWQRSEPEWKLLSLIYYYRYHNLTITYLRSCPL